MLSRYGVILKRLFQNFSIGYEMSANIKCLTPQEEERFLDILRNRKDAERAYMLYHLMLVTGLRISEALSLNVEHAGRAKLMCSRKI